MFTHVVMFKLKDRSPDHVRQTHDILAAMEGKIPQVLELSVGIDCLHQGRSYDLVLISKHRSAEDYYGYHEHPAHQAVLGHMKEVVESSVSVDYETQ